MEIENLDELCMKMKSNVEAIKKLSEDDMKKAEKEINAYQESIKKEIEKKRKKKIMYQDVINEAKRTFSSDPEEIISDIRPAERPFIDSMIKTSENGVPVNVSVYVP